jgi:hypothetical protein
MPEGEGPPEAALLERALALAVAKHAGQRDRHGEPYILHVLRVMLRMPDATCRLAAVLHDIVEDTDVTLADLAAIGVRGEALEAVRLLTIEGKPDREAYLAHVRALAPHRVARTVKRADLLDKLELGRIRQVREEDLARFERYLAALAILDAAEAAGGGQGPAAHVARR